MADRVLMVLTITLAIANPDLLEIAVKLVCFSVIINHLFLLLLFSSILCFFVFVAL